MRKPGNLLSAISALFLMYSACSSPPPPRRAARCATLHERLKTCLIQDGAIPSTISLSPKDQFVQGCQTHWVEMKAMVDCIERKGCDGFSACFLGNRTGTGGAPSAEQ